MPAISTGGGSLAEYGLHYDEAGNPEKGAYDYSATTGTDAWLRGTAADNQLFSARYMYWQEGNCRVRARLQRFINGAWQDYCDWDAHVLHLNNMPTQTSYTQTVTWAGDWLYKVVGKVAHCATTQDHVHLSASIGASFAVVPKSNDTCWSDSSQCSIGRVRKHDPTPTNNPCPPGRTIAVPTRTPVTKSGNVTQYICETWSLSWRTDQTAAFEIK